MAKNRWRECVFCFGQGCEVIEGSLYIGYSRDGKPFSRLKGISARDRHPEERESSTICRAIDIPDPPRNCGCDNAKPWRVRFGPISFRTQGRPIWLRYRWRWPHLLYVDEPGCGCPLKPRAFYDALAYSFRIAWKV